MLEVDRTLASRLAEGPPDVVFPALHGPPGEDGTIQGLLTMLGLPYVGSDVHASAFAMDKARAKDVFRAIGLPVADDASVGRDWDETTIATLVERLGERVVVKPCRQGSALGVGFADDAQSLAGALEAALALDTQVLVEARIDGREITVGVLEERDEQGSIRRIAHPVIEIVTPRGDWYDYEHRYTAGASEHRVPASLPDACAQTLQQIAVDAHVALGCRDLSRADFIVTGDDDIVLLEVNTLPGMTPTSLYPDGAAALGIAFPELLARLVRNARRRGPDLPLG